MSADSIFRALVESALKEAHNGASDDEDEGEAAAEAGPDESNRGHEILTRAALLARACLPNSLTLLTSLLRDRADKLTGSPSEKGVSQSLHMQIVLA